jgi:hypothetical protein
MAIREQRSRGVNAIAFSCVPIGSDSERGKRTRLHGL